MKKIMMLLLIACIATGCAKEKGEDISYCTTPECTEDEDYKNQNIESEYYEIVSFAKLKQLLEEDTPKLIYFGSEGCGACLAFKPIAKKFAKEKQIPIYFALLDEFSNEEYNELDKIISFEYIPYITVYKNKEFIYQQSGVHSYELLEDLVKEHRIGA